MEARHQLATLFCGLLQTAQPGKNPANSLYERFKQRSRIMLVLSQRAPFQGVLRPPLQGGSGVRSDYIHHRVPAGVQCRFCSVAPGRLRLLTCAALICTNQARRNLGKQKLTFVLLKSGTESKRRSSGVNALNQHQRGVISDQNKSLYENIGSLTTKALSTRTCQHSPAHRGPDAVGQEVGQEVVISHTYSLYS